MLGENSFDEVHDCQATFRLMLHAISNPGEIVCIDEYAGKLNEEDGVMLMIALTLLDKETKFFAAGNREFAKAVTELTYSRHTNESAGFIFITKKIQNSDIAGIFARATPGTLVEPHTGSILLISVEGFDNEASCVMKGPGIDESKKAGLTEYAKRWIMQRNLMGYEYPAGIDIFFVTDFGEIMAIPRKVKMEG